MFRRVNERASSMKWAMTLLIVIGGLCLVSCGSMGGMLSSISLPSFSGSGGGGSKKAQPPQEKKIHQTEEGTSTARIPRRPSRRRQYAEATDNGTTRNRQVSDASWSTSSSSNSSRQSSSSSSSRESQDIWVNGRKVRNRPRAKARSRKKAAFKATCKHNRDCKSNTCWVGAGRIGYCTKMCDSFSECPSFWKCRKAASNAPQKICVQK
jgi:hypothetical protein